MNKQIRKVVSILFLLVTIVTLSSATKSPFYTRNVIITKIYPHKSGYKIIYMTNDLTNKVVYIPTSLFKKSNGSKIFYGYNKSYPSMTIFWKDGEFSHIKLYLKEDFRDISWGSFANPDEYDDKFNNTEIEFKF